MIILLCNKVYGGLNMEKIRIVCDAASDITPDEAKDLGIDLLRAVVTIDGESFEEGEVSKEDYLQMLLDCKEVPTTAQVTPEKCIGAYKRAIEDGIEELIVVTISSFGSGFYNNANMAIAMLKEEIGEFDLKITIIDSLAYTYCFGEPVRHACKMIKDGVSKDEIVLFLKERYSKTEAFAGVYNLRFAKKSGRISGIAAFAGEVLGLKPIVHLINGKVDIPEKVRGEKMIIPKLIDLVSKNAVDIKKQDIIIFHGIISDEQLSLLEKSIKKQLNPKSFRFETIGASIATNTGPYVCGIVFDGKVRG